MSRIEDFNNEFWSDPDVLDLSPGARYLYIWTWTNPRCGMSGIYQVGKTLMQAETGIANLDPALEELAAARFAFYDGRWMFVRARVKRLRQKHPNIAKSILSDLRHLPAGHELLRAFGAEYWHTSFATKLKELAEGRLSPEQLLTLSGASSEGQPTLPELFAEGQSTLANPNEQGTSLRVPQPFPEGHPTLQGEGEGAGSSSEDQPEVSTRANAHARHPRLDEVLAVFRTVPADRLQVQELAVNAVCWAKPEADVVAAAQMVASWALEGGMRSTSAGRLLGSALAKLDEQQAKIDGARAAAEKSGGGVSRGQQQPRGVRGGKYDTARGIA